MEFFNNIYFNIIDIIIIIILLTSCIVATFRGFIKEAFSIISWLFSLMVAFHLYERFKLELLNYLNQEIIIDIIAFGFPFLTTLLISHFISKWLSPKFSVSSFLFFDKILGFVFGMFRGVIIIILVYLGFLYLIGKDRILPNILLEAYSYKYIQASSDILGNVFMEGTNIDNKNKKSIEPNGS